MSRRESHSKAVTKRGAARPIKASGSSGKIKKSEPATCAEPVDAAGRAETATRIEPAATRSIDLSPVDWRRATFRPRQPLPRPQIAPFNLDRCTAILAQAPKDRESEEIYWRDLQLPPAMSREEAHFWLEAISTAENSDASLKSIAAKLAKKTFDGRVSLAQAAKYLKTLLYDMPPEVMLPLVNLLRPGEILELANSLLKENRLHGEEISVLLTEGFSYYAVPYLTDEEFESFRQAVRAGFDPAMSAGDVWRALPAEHYLAAGLGMHDEAYAITSSWADDRYSRHYKGTYLGGADEVQRPQDILFGLGSAELVESEWRRLKLRMRSPVHVRGFLACTEYAALDLVRDSVLAVTDKEPCRELLNALALVRAPEAAEPMLACKLGSKAPAAARDWLEKNLACAVTGLVGTASGRGKLADAAQEFLQDAKRRGYGSIVDAAAESSSDTGPAARAARKTLSRQEKTYEPLDAAATPAWLRQALAECAKVKSRRLPGWASPAMLPPLVLGERRLNDEQLVSVLKVLAATPLAAQHPLLSGLRECVAAACRDEFAWKLFQSWLDDEAPAKEKWAMASVGHLGGDASALRLMPLVRQWPAENQHSRAVFGLECLRAIGTDAALMQLAGTAQTVKSKGLKAKAEQFVNEIAAQRGLTRAELEDRIVPDCGLDENGRREFSYGPRSFSFALSGELTPMIRDADGKLRSELPKPGAKDDDALTARARADWKLLKKQIKEAATIQAGRLEQAMITGRRWKTADFEALLVRHPLLGHLTRQLVWGAFDERGRRLTTFRVTETRDYADSADHAVSLAGAATIGLLHPLEMSPEERAVWGEALSDYNVASPFPQLGRAVHALAPGEAKLDDLKRFHGLRLVAPALVFTLERLGWTRGLVLGGGCFDEHSKQFPAADATAIISYDGVASAGHINPNHTLTINSVRFVSGMRPPSECGWGAKHKLTLGRVPPIVVSEVLADLEVLKSKST